MVVDVNRSIRFRVEPRAEVVAAESSAGSRGGPGRLRSWSKRLWRGLVNALSGPGLDDSAFPSSFSTPYGRGGRQVRSLWHEPF